MTQTQPRPVTLLLCLAICLIGVATIDLCRSWFDTPSEALALPAPPSAASLERTVSTASESPQGQVEPEQPNRTQLLRDREELSRANAALEKARQEAEKERMTAEKDSELWSGLAGALLDGKLKVPKNLAEAAVSIGQHLAKTAKLKRKWGDTAPAEGSPGAAEYQKDREELVTDTAAMMKFFSDEKMSSEITKPDNISQFQSLSLYGSLGLSEDQWRQVDAALSNIIVKGFRAVLMHSRNRKPESTHGDNNALI